ncbi:hypothetical protein EVAR_41937_1 [Eumeta japonica]|uniref:Uncharacterized protein n=1 Tax=Eumeta variegata TaxID=151549 RepID=A0A4C1XM39_EUMVA|nr:hypothetical protein EVAR_41937_1 [Eumeta japonica]
MCIRTVMTYASPVFVHAALKALHRLQVIDLSSLLHPAAANRLRPGRREGNRPVTVSCDILCRDDFHQASSIACHAPSALACAVRPHSVKLSKSSDLSSDSSRPTK